MLEEFGLESLNQIPDDLIEDVRQLIYTRTFDDEFYVKAQTVKDRIKEYVNEPTNTPENSMFVDDLDRLGDLDDIDKLEAQSQLDIE